MTNCIRDLFGREGKTNCFLGLERESVEKEGLPRRARSDVVPVDSLGQPVEVLDEEMLREGLQDEKGFAIESWLEFFLSEYLEISNIYEVFSFVMWSTTTWVGIEVALCDF